LPGRICKICADTGTVKRAAELIGEGLPDQKIADRLGFYGSAGRMLISRHRRFHVEAPARAIAEAAAKGRPNVQEREQAIAIAEAGDIASAFLSLERIAADLRHVQERLERTADAAEADKQRLAVASLSGQQLRAAELRARLGGVGAYSPTQNAIGSARPVVVTRVERILVEVSRREPEPGDGTVIDLDDRGRDIDDPETLREEPR
jgi:hypothetical protein